MDITVELNMRFQPIHLYELEDALDEILEKTEKGEVTGDGFAQDPSGEVSYCDIEIDLYDGSPENIKWLKDGLNKMSIAKGSKLIYGDKEEAIGSLEGAAYYLNGIDLPEEIYQSCDVNYAIDQIDKLLDGVGRLYSWYEGNEFTALYYYGTSFEEMIKRIEPFAGSYPLFEKCIIKQIA
ncbi:MAG: hypothetical protein IJ740_02455 [Ruminococcus sp.]|nr:hypothetical protein [Ruminococcus sp.]